MPVKRRKKPAAKKASKPKQPKKKASKPKKHPIRVVLDVIEKALLKNDSNSAHLWNLLAATRGPDNIGLAVKYDFTAPIRGWMFPKVAGQNNALDIIPACMRPWTPKTLKQMPTFDQSNCAGQHFMNHINSALNAINAVDHP